MNMWADGSSRFQDPKRFRTITVREFVRRFRRGVVHNEKSYIWLLGAGCSASAGVPTADAAVQRWLKDLKYLETGQDGDLELWAAKRFVGYDPEQSAAIYGDVFSALFHTEQEQRLEIERMVDSAEPGFGYATLAQLMTHKNWGLRTSLAITTNFDDLCADALHLFSQKRPQVLTNESINHMTPIGSGAPTVVKIFGDAHLPKSARKGNRPQLESIVRERLIEQMADAVLIFAGYGGRDECVLDLLESLPAGSPTGGLFWVNAEPPRGAFGEQFERRGGVWVEHNEFDALMYYVRVEFGLGHPPIERFEQLMNRYNAQYRELSTRAGLELNNGSAGGDSRIEPPARAALPGGVVDDGLDLNAVNRKGGRRETEKSRYDRMRRSLDVVKRAVEGSAKGDRREVTIEEFNQPLANDDTPTSGSPSEALTPIGDGRGDPVGGLRSRAMDDVDDLLGKAVQELIGRDQDHRVMRPDQSAVSDSDSAGFVRPVLADRPTTASFKDADSEETQRTQGQRRFYTPVDRLADEVEIAIPTPGEGQIGASGIATAVTLPPDPIHRLTPQEAEPGEKAFQAALDAAPTDAALHARHARYLVIAVGDMTRAEAAFERAHQLQPKNVGILRDYAVFALERRRDFPRAERLLTRALNLDLRNAETLLALANFLLRARGDLDEAENCLRLAVEVGQKNVRAQIAYAHFLDERRGRRDAAEAQLRRATEIRPPSGRALAELALFRAQNAALDAAEQALGEAESIAADDAVTVFARAMVLEKRGDEDAAERMYKHSLTMDPASVRARLAFAKFLEMRRSALNGAERQYRNAIAVSPHLAEPIIEYARFLRIARSDPAKAESFYQRAIETEPFNPFVLVAQAEFTAAKGGSEEAAETYFRDALAQAPGASAVRRSYGRFLAKIKRDPEAAEAQFRRAVDIDPNSAAALDELADFLHKVRRDSEEAEVYYRQALKVAPERAETLHRFATFLRETRKDVQEAERYYRRAVDNNPKDASTLARAAQFLLAQGRRQEGLKVLNECFDSAWRMDPDHRPSTLMLELWIYRFAHDPARRDEALDAALALIDAGVRCDGWDLEATVTEAIRRQHPDPDTLRDLVAVACEGANPNILESRRS
jgi:Tfp pilus assembly protein PilF